MKYNLTEDEKKGIDDGRILTIACYNSKHAATAEFITKNQGIPYTVQQSESPLGKNIFIFFLYPNTFYQAFRVGDILNCPDLYQDELVKIIPTWDNTFNQLNHEKEIARG